MRTGTESKKLKIEDFNAAVKSSIFFAGIIVLLMMADWEVKNNISLNRFEVNDEGETGFLEYDADEKNIALLHTEVPGNIGGKGIAQALAAYAFGYAKQHGLKVLVYCPYVATYVKRHPELNEFVGEK